MLGSEPSNCSVEEGAVAPGSRSAGAGVGPGGGGGGGGGTVGPLVRPDEQPATGPSSTTRARRDRNVMASSRLVRRSRSAHRPVWRPPVPEPYLSRSWNPDRKRVV